MCTGQKAEKSGTAGCSGRCAGPLSGKERVEQQQECHGLPQQGDAPETKTSETEKE